MAVLRTKRLGFYSSTAAVTAHPIYQCPPLHRAIVRDVRWCNFDAAPRERNLLTVSRSGVVLVILTDTHLDATPFVAGQQMDAVLEEGDELHVYIEAGGVGVYVSGAELPLPAA